LCFRAQQEARERAERDRQELERKKEREAKIQKELEKLKELVGSLLFFFFFFSCYSLRASELSDTSLVLKILFPRQRKIGSYFF
jgi:hypothetical protein